MLCLLFVLHVLFSLHLTIFLSSRLDELETLNFELNFVFIHLFRDYIYAIYRCHACRK